MSHAASAPTPDSSPDTKRAGLLAPLFALRSEHDLGVGDIAALYELIDWAAPIGISFIQMLPINETGSDHSPYNAISSVAIEPSTLSLRPEDLPDLTPNDFPETTNDESSFGVDYARVKALKLSLLETAFQNFKKLPPACKRRRNFRKFQKKQSDWLTPWTLFKALQQKLKTNEVFADWPEEFATYQQASNWLEAQEKKTVKSLCYQQEFYAYIQWIAFTQWQEIRHYANQKNILLIGDVPVGVSRYSCDVWSSPHLFDLQRSSGAPPEKVFSSDPFTERWGQNWGFPLYDWFAMSHDNFWWWRQRLRLLLSVFDILRVDHALGFFRIYSFPWQPHENEKFTNLSHDEAAALTGGPLPGFIPFEDDSDEHRERNRLHGLTLFKILLEETGPDRILAEDLGEVPDYVPPTLTELQISGFKIPFWQNTPEGKLTPGDQYPRRSICTFSTHDHPPLRSTWNQLISQNNPHEEYENLARFLDIPPDTLQPWSQELHTAFFDALFSSNSWLAAFTINDFLGTEDRFNVPGSISSANWTARISTKISHWNQTWPAEIQAARISIRKHDRLPPPPQLRPLT
ncbi:MAG: 4-alpha-glucanotransferase [Chthoniobacterales bacterium]